MKALAKLAVATILALTVGANVLAKPSDRACDNPHRSSSAPAHGIHKSGHCT